jgi:predicted ArsR family transcriptional regulator
MRPKILVFIKTQDGAFVRDVAAHFGITHEGARKQLVRMEADGWLARRPSLEGVGRPKDGYTVAPAGEQLLPKAYDKLSLAMLSQLREGPAGLRETLAGLARRQIEAWSPKLEGKDTRGKLEALSEIYAEEDPFVSLEISEKEARLTERNCPFLNVAMEHPALCSLTVNTLEGLLGHPVIREEKFQAGHGRCVFRVLLDRKLPEKTFTLESERLSLQPAQAA